MHRSRPSVLAAALAAFALIAAACGGDDASSEPTTTPVPADDAGLDDDDAGDAGDADDDDPDDAGDDPSDLPGADDYVPGDDRIRVVNLLDDPVDVYVRTTDGLVTAYLVQAGVAPGEVTEYFSPPDPGRLIVVEAGAGDAECVSTCPHILADVRTSEDTGPVITTVVYVDDFSSDIRSFWAWENPGPGDTASANRMPEPDPSAGLIVPLGIALQDAQFGLRLAIDGIDGCQENRDQANILVGGTSTVPYVYDGMSADIVFHDNQDRECVEEPVGGPFTISGGPGTRVLLVLSGTPGDMDGIVLSLGGDDETPTPPADSSDTGDPSDGDPGDNAAGDGGAIADALGDFLAMQLPLSGTEASCLADLIVDRVGADALTAPGGGPIDFEVVDPDLEDALVGALISGIGLCDIDPSILE